MSNIQPLKILLADDHDLFRDGLASLLSYHEDMQVLAHARNGQEAVQLAQNLLPDVVLMDIDMPILDGLQATQAIVATIPAIKIVMLTVHEEEEKLFEAIKCGAQGYLLKNIRSNEMLEMLRGIVAGEAPISRIMATRLLQEFARTNYIQVEPPTPTAPPSDSNLNQLSMREREVLQLVAQRATNKEIATRLNVSEYTIKNHLRNILAKLHLRNRSEAANILLRSSSSKK